MKIIGYSIHPNRSREKGTKVSTSAGAMEKRKSENQLTKDSVPSEEEEAIVHGFEKAPEDVLKARKICKVKRSVLPPSSGGSPARTNPFAGIALQAQKQLDTPQDGLSDEQRNDSGLTTKEDQKSNKKEEEKKIEKESSSPKDAAKATLAQPVLGGGFGGLAKGAGGFGGLAFGNGTGSSSLSFNGGLAFGKMPSGNPPNETAVNANNDTPAGNAAVAHTVMPVFGSTQQTKGEEEDRKEAIITGEEEEDTLYSCTASLYEFEKAQWKEKGKGMLKVNKHKENRTIRLIMRQQGNLKLLLNAIVWNGMKVTKMEESKGISFSCVNHLTDDSSDSLGMFAIRARDAAAINALCDTIDTHKSQNLRAVDS